VYSYLYERGWTVGQVGASLFVYRHSSILIDWLVTYFLQSVTDSWPV